MTNQTAWEPAFLFVDGATTLSVVMEGIREVMNQAVEGTGGPPVLLNQPVCEESVKRLNTAKCRLAAGFCVD